MSAFIPAMASTRPCGSRAGMWSLLWLIHGMLVQVALPFAAAVEPVLLTEWQEMLGYHVPRLSA